MNGYELKVGEFQGPLDKLLELIEGRELEVSRLNLAEVTADFIKYLNSLSNIHPKILADFITIASKLILIKSHALLPSLELSKEEEEEIKDLEDRLRLYKEFKQAEKIIKKLWAKKMSYSRDFLLEAKEGFYLSQPITPDDLAKIIQGLASELTVIFPKLEGGEVKMVNFEEKLQELLRRVNETAKASFKDVARGKARSEIVVMFLAILHLLKDSLIKVDQEKEFEDINIEKV